MVLRLPILVVSVAMVLLLSVARAQDNLGVALGECAAIEADEQRLACFDALAAGVEGGAAEEPANPQPAAPVAAPAPAAGGWINNVTRDPMTDFENSVWRVTALNTIPDGMLGSTRPAMIVRCRDDTTELYIDWGRYISTGDLYNRHSVTTRIDDAPAVRADWSLSTDFEATFTRGAIGFLRTMRGAVRLLAETIPFGSSAVRAEFNITGIDEVVADVSSRCHWTP